MRPLGACGVLKDLHDCLPVLIEDLPLKTLTLQFVGRVIERL